MTDPEFGAQPPHRPAPPHRPIPQVLLRFREAELGQARLAALLDRPRLLVGSAGGCGSDALPPGRRHPPDLMLLQQAPQSVGCGAKLAPDLRQRPCAGDQPVHQVGPHPSKAELGDPSGGALLGGVLALAGQPLAVGWLADVSVLDRAADGRLGGAKVAGELGDAAAVVQQDLQAGREAGEAQAPGLLVEVVVAAIADGEAAVEDQAARQTC